MAHRRKLWDEETRDFIGGIGSDVLVRVFCA
jgi:hypothetical protein